MTYAYQKPIYLSRGCFKCQDCESNGFYHQIIGLEILSQTDRSDFGTWSKSLVHLIQAKRQGK